MAGKSGKCPKCGNIIRVPRPLGTEESGGGQMSAHVQGIKVRGGVQKEEVPLRGAAITGFTRSTALARAYTSPQAMAGLVLAAVGLVAALVPTAVEAPPVLGMAGGMVGALGAAIAGWGFMNISQRPHRLRGKGLALAGIVVGVLALVLALLVFTGGVGTAKAGGLLPAKRAATQAMAGKAELQPCAEQLQAAYKILRRYAQGHKGPFPGSLMQLMPKYIDTMTPLCCPTFSDGTLQYEYTTGLALESPPETPLLYDPAGNHEGGRNVLLVSGKVVWMTEEELQESLPEKPADTE
jgi:hypothetical protein